jgi:hypoxanthine phosphoribosyltransferase
MAEAKESKLRVLIPAEKIHARIREMGEQITKDYPEGPIYMIGILKGSWIFLADLVRAIPRHVRVEFIGISSYGKGKTSSGEVRLTKDIDVSLEGMDIIVVEDIVDTGVTLTYLIHLLEQRKPRSIRVATLLDKPSRRLRPIQSTYSGFTVPDEFVVGYGLDFAEDYRNLPDICVVE